MALVASDIVATFPEFTKVDTALVTLKLAEAYRRTNSSVWDTLQDDGAKWLCAHLLAVSPFGMNARMVNKDGTTVYGEERKTLEKIVASGFRVTAATTT